MSEDKLYSTCNICEKEFEVDEHESYQITCNSCEAQADAYYEERKEQQREYFCTPPDDQEAR